MADNVAITKAPTAKVSYMSAPRRNTGGSRTFQVTFDLAEYATSEKNGARVEGFEVLWDVRAQAKSNGKKTLIRHFRAKYGEPGRREVHLDLNGFRPTELKKNLTRNDYYPMSGWCVRMVMCAVRTYNRKGYGPWVVTQNSFLQPAAPSISALTQDAASGNVSCKVSVPSGENMQEVYDGYWTRTVYDSSTKQTLVSHGAIPRGGSATIGYDVSDRQRLTYAQYVRVKVEAYTRGYWGDSKVNSRTLYVSWPTKPTISKLEIPNARPATKATVRLKYVANTGGKLSVAPHPTTGVKLQKLANVPYATAAAIPGDAAWEDVAEDDGECTALSCSVGDLQPEAGMHSWVRVKAWNQVESIFYIYSDPIYVKALYKAPPPEPTAADDPAVIVSAEPGSDGKSIALTWAWQPAGTTDDSTGTEISWSDDKRCWSSVTAPKTHQTTTKGTAKNTKVGTTTYKRVATIYVNSGVENGKTYYLRVRRYLVGAGGTEYGRYSSIASCALVAPEEPAEASNVSVVCTAPRYVERGGSLEVSWSWKCDNEDATQTSWQVITGKATTSGKTSSITSGTKVLARGADGRGAATVSPSKLASAAGTAATLPVAVVVTVGGVTAQSPAVPVSIADRPTLRAFAPAVSAQPATIGLYASAECDVAATLRAVGAAGDFPGGMRRQAGGDVVWSDAASPAWSSRGLDLGNLVTNLPANWERGALLAEDEYEDGQLVASAGGETPSTTCVRLSSGQAVAMTPGSSYTVGLTATAGAVGCQMAAYAYDEEGSYVPQDSAPAWQDGPVTLRPASATSLRLALRHADGSKTYPDEVGSQVMVMACEGASAQEWVPHRGDLEDLSSSLELPEGLELWDGARYVVTATATDRRTGLTSEEASAELAVAWARKASVPDGCVVEASDTTDERGVRTRQATVAVVAPEGATDSDSYDLYRVTDDGAALVAESLVAGAVARDPYAPWDGTYRVAMRTPDGDVAWWDYPYELAGGDVRIDYEGDFGPAYVELPHNLTVQDDYSKAFELRRKLDGSMDGYWCHGVERRGSLGVDLDVAGEYGAVMADLRGLARHVGPCFVRTPDGCAYEADVEVGGLDRSAGPDLFAVTIDATEVSLTSEYMPTVTAPEGVEP